MSASTSKSSFSLFVLKILIVCFLLFIFLFGVSSLSASFKMMGADFAATLLGITSHPVLSLIAGMFATSLIQSSSTSTSLIVGLCSSGVLSIKGAVPMIMGANIGTSVTNTIVSMGYMKSRGHFRRAFGAATVHDAFNLLSVILILPLELATGIIEKTATQISSHLYGASFSLHFKSPLKAVLKPMTRGLKSFITETMGFEGAPAGITMMIIAGAIIVLALTSIVKTTKTILNENRQSTMEKLLSRNPYISMIHGIWITFMVQSSSITTSLLVPLAGAGALSTKSIFPITVGANIGTTATAIIASLSGNRAGLTIAMVHLIFNLMGTLIWLPIPKMRAVPVKIAEHFGSIVEKNRHIALIYLLMIFFVIPFLLVIL